AAALGRVARVRGDEHLGRVARAWALSERTGAGLAEAVEAAARSGRQAVDHTRRVRAATAGARASVTLLTLLPVGGTGVGLLLVLAGRLVVARMVTRVEASWPPSPSPHSSASPAGWRCRVPPPRVPDRGSATVTRTVGGLRAGTGADR